MSTLAVNSGTERARHISQQPPNNFTIKHSLVTVRVAKTAAAVSRINLQRPTSTLTSEFRCSVLGPRYRLSMMTPERRFDIVSTATLVLAAAAWLFFLFAYADVIFF